MKRSNNAFLKRQKELARNQKKQEKRQRLLAQRAQKGTLDANDLDADASDLEGLGLADRAPLASSEEPEGPTK